MKKIIALNIARLVNAKHFEFMDFVAGAISKYNIVEERLPLFVTAYRTAFAKEDHAYQNLDRSFLTNEIAAAKTNREVRFRALRDLIRAYVTDPDSATRNAAEILLKVTDGYGGSKIPNLPADSQSGIYTNLVDDLETKYSEQTQLLGGLEARVQGLKDANAQYIDLIFQRTQFDAEIGKSLMEDARKEMDEAYHCLTDTINALIGIGHGTEFQQFVSFLNVRIEDVRSKLGQGSAAGGGDDTDTVKNVTLTFEKANDTVIKIEGEPGESYEIPELAAEHIWVKKDGELLVPNGIFPDRDTTFIEVPVGERKSVVFHFLSGEHETFSALPGTEYEVPATDDDDCQWVPEPTGIIPDVDTQYFETRIPAQEEEEEEEDERPKYKITFRAGGSLVAIKEYHEGETIVPPECPEGFRWPDDMPTVMPAQNVTVRAEGLDD